MSGACMATAVGDDIGHLGDVLTDLAGEVALLAHEHDRGGLVLVVRLLQDAAAVTRVAADFYGLRMAVALERERREA